MVGLTKQAIKKTLGRAFVTLQQLETIVTEIEAMLNDSTLTYVSPDVLDPEPLTPSHLLFGRICQVPHALNKPEELDDPTYVSDDAMREKVNKHSMVIEKFWNHWKTLYLTSLREFNKTSGYNKEVIKVGDVAIVHDDKPRLQRKLSLIEGLIKGVDNLVRAAHIRIGSYRTTRPIVKLYPLEVSNPDRMNPKRTCNTAVGDTEHSQPTVDETSVDSNPPNSQRVKREAASKALQNISKWTAELSRALEDVGND